MAQRTLQNEVGKKTPFDSPAQEAFLNLIRTASILEGDLAPLLKAQGLSESSYNALRILRGHHPAGCPCGTIGEHMVVRVPDITRLLDRLERAALAIRERDTVDRRVVIAKITRKGLDVLAKLDGPMLKAHEAQLAHLSASELRTLSALLVKARSAAPNATP